MSYCVQCGVKLSDYHEKCPLCGTEVANPNNPAVRANSDYPDYHVINEDEKRPIRHYVTGIILTIQAFVYSVVVFIVDALTGGGITWSVIPILSLVLLWVTVAYPFFRKKNTFFRLFTYDSIATIIYILLLNLIISGNFLWARYVVVGIVFVWIIIAGIFLTEKIRKVFPITIYYILSAVLLSFLALAFVEQKIMILRLGLPIMISFFVISLISYFIIKSTADSILSIFTVLLVAVTLQCVIVDLSMQYNINNVFELTWSLIVIVVTIPSAATLLGIKKSNELYAAISRKLHR